MIPILRSILLCCSSLIWAWLWHIYQFLKVESELISPCLLVSWSLGGLFDSISMLMWILCLSWFKCTAHDLRGVQKELLQNIIFSEAKTSQFYHFSEIKPMFYLIIVLQFEGSCNKASFCSALLIKSWALSEDLLLLLRQEKREF